MARSLLNMPPELLVQILAFLPVQALLKFSQTSQYSHSLAKSSLHTLALGIHTTRVSSAPPHEDDPYNVSVVIPDAQAFDYLTLLSFHTALTTNILFRHGSTLRNLHLSLWTLTEPTSRALASLSALRVLSIRIEAFPHLRAVPHSRFAQQRVEQHKAWSLLASTAAWAPRLHALRIDGAELNTRQLTTLLRPSRWCRELWISNCAMVGPELWTFLASEWEARSALQVLGVMNCGGQLDEHVLDLIGALDGLQFLSLRGCYGLDSDAVEKRNNEAWHIPECILSLPRVVNESGSMLIEVDPAYLEADD
ncbi:hypothetical protein BDV95DRAFT_503111 [Massariosphaeria phaeospora]|uniref:F-box domain-containing protein n=1 Tax=Massariosphaeria phaeospora TaxID=100035 RepID=A0A7C8M321_9PLEO|nr:hypothetical protein BDV95DRAFT_503111 [Massariosphaeria phaeospora]